MASDAYVFLFIDNKLPAEACQCFLFVMNFILVVRVLVEGIFPMRTNSSILILTEAGFGVDKWRDGFPSRWVSLSYR
jgi:hypothetical protein